MQRTGRRQITLVSSLVWIALTALGYLANVFHVPLFFNVDFLFGSVFSLIILHYFGWGPAIVSALIISSHTAVLWNHPYAEIILAVEIVLVGLFYRKSGRNMVLLDTIFWVAVGMPLVILFYGLVMGIAPQSTALVVFKQAINGIVNALVASVIIGIVRHYFPSLDESHARAPFNFSQAIFLMMVAFVLLPATLILVVTARSEMERVETDVASKLEITTFSARQSINAWIVENLQTLNSLASYVNMDQPGDQDVLRGEMALLNMSDGDFAAMAVVDPLGRLIAGEPADHATELLANPRLAQWPYFTRLLTGMSGVASNVISAEGAEFVLLGVPIIRRDTMYGAVLGVVDVHRLREELFRLSGRWMLDATIVDGSNRVVATTHTGAQSFDEFDHVMPLESEHERGNLFLRAPGSEAGRSVMERWQDSEYIAVDRIGSNSSWMILLQASVAPYQDALNERYRSMLLVMLLVVVSTIFLSSALSRRLLGSLTRLTRVTENLPEKVTQQEEIDWPTSRINEIDALIQSFCATSSHLGDSFRRLQETNEELSAAKQQAEAASRTKSEFLANISHDLRTPLNGILGYAQILSRDESLDAQTHEAVGIIEKSGNHLLNLISDILDVSRIEARKMSLEPVSIRLPSFLDDIADIIALQARLKGLAFETSFSHDLPDAVLVDERRLRQVLLNLLNNAVKFTDEGTVAFNVGVAEDGIAFEVCDTGTGIPEDQLEEIFSPFKQLEKHIRNEEGTGLGLAIVQRLVTMMGGEVHVSSNLGEGSSFRFVVDLPQTDEPPAAAPRPASSISGYEGPRKTVLVVDDKRENRSVVRGMLEPLGFAVVEAEDGRKGVTTMHEVRPDLVLMDLVMPVLDGFDAIREIRAQESMSTTPVVALSASVAESIRAECLRVGFTEFLPKPFRQNDLLEIVRTAADLTWTHATAKEVFSGEEQNVRFLPDELLDTIEHEVESGNIRRIVDVADRMGIEHPAYASALAQVTRLARQFRMNELADYVESLRESVENK